MIALDTSALVAIATEEHGHESFHEALLTLPGILGAATLLELHIVLQRKGLTNSGSYVDEMIALPNLLVVPLTRNHFEAARLAFDVFGKGRGHPAQLNFGDCLAYAVAKVANVPLLFKGDDFLHTDIQPAHRA